MKKKYSEQLQNPLWQKKRLEIFNRDNFACQLCSDESSTLNVHHKYYKKDTQAWEYPNDALVTYCKHCHSVVEYLKKENPNLYPSVLIKKVATYVGGESIFLMGIVKEKDSNVGSVIVLDYKEDNITYALLLSESAIKTLQDLMILSKKL